MVGGGVEEKRLAEEVAAGVAAATAGVGALAVSEGEGLDKGKGKEVDGEEEGEWSFCVEFLVAWFFGEQKADLVWPFRERHGQPVALDGC